MTDTSTEIPSEITFDVWSDYAKRGKIGELDDALVAQFGLILPEAMSSPDDPIMYAEDLRKFFVDHYKLGENKIRDMYVVRRISLGLKEASQKFDAKGNALNAVQFEDGVAEGFQILAENYSNANQRNSEYYKDFDDPQLFISLFGPIMEVLPDEKIEGVVNMVANEEQFQKIIDEYKKGGTDGQSQ